MRALLLTIPVMVFFASCSEVKNNKVGSCYCRTGNTVLYLHRNTNGAIDSLKLPDANADYFELVYDELPGDECFNANIWAKDKSNVWYKNHILKGADPSTFKVMENGYSKDKTYVYYLQFPVSGANPNELETPGWFYAKTRTGIWYCGKPVKGIEDITSFTVFDSYFSKDKHAVYFFRDSCFIKLNGSDPNTFKCITEDKAFRTTGLKWYNDKTGVYCIDTQIDQGSDDFLSRINASVETFKIFPGKYYSCDATVVYYKNKPLLKADIKTFETLGMDYARDTVSVYYQNMKLNGVDIKSFKTVEGESDYDASDSKNRYLKGKKIN